MKGSLNKIQPHRTDYSFLHTFGAVDSQSLPASFSIYDGRPIPNQNDIDTRFNPFLPPLPMGCTGETAAFESGIQDGQLYNPKWIYDNTPPGGSGGRDIRKALQFIIDNGPAAGDGDVKRKGYFIVYGAGKITDFDAVKIALWVNQNEKRGVWVGTYFYDQFINGRVSPSAVVSVPSFNTKEASLHCWLVTGWKTIDGKEYLEGITWQGEKVGFRGITYFSKEIYNALMAQPWTGAFTISKYEKAPIAIGWQAIVDHLIYFVTSLFNLTHAPSVDPVAKPKPEPVTPVPTPETSSERLAEAAMGMLGKDASPKNLAPQELSCAEGVSNIIHSVWPDFAGDIVSTQVLLQTLKNDRRFKPVLDPKRGCIVVSPTVGDNHGHTGIYTHDDTIASNDSRTGKFEENYNRASWRLYFISRKGLKGYLFEPV